MIAEEKNLAQYMRKISSQSLENLDKQIIEIAEKEIYPKLISRIEQTALCGKYSLFIDIDYLNKLYTSFTSFIPNINDGRGSSVNLQLVRPAIENKLKSCGFEFKYSEYGLSIRWEEERLKNDL